MFSIEGPARLGAVSRLEAALRSVLNESFDDEIKAQLERHAWYSADLPSRELFRLWVVENLEAGLSPQWVFEPIRASERKFVCAELGIPRADIVGMSPRRLAAMVLEASGLPVAEVWGRAREIQHWRRACELVGQEEDERASVVLRRLGERVLRKTLHFHSATGLAGYLLEVLGDPGNVRLPSLLEKIQAEAPDERIETLRRTLESDGWATLGLLNLLLAKFSRRVQKGGEQDLTGRPLIILEADDQAAFDLLSRALQAYAHDKPSELRGRRSRLAAWRRGSLRRRAAHGRAKRHSGRNGRVGVGREPAWAVLSGNRVGGGAAKAHGEQSPRLWMSGSL